MDATTPALPARAAATVDVANDAAAAFSTAALTAASAAVEAITDSITDVEPKLRGWLHAGLAPLATAGGVTATVLAPAGAATLATAVFTISALLLFTVSALYNIRSWSPSHELLLRRLDHANIFWFIAGTYTPFTVLLLEGTTQTVFLIAVWSMAAAGATFKVVWPHAPRWISVPPYFVFGGASLLVVDAWAAAGAWVVGLLAAGGIAYMIGGLAYAFRRPNPFPAWFGYHEVFHTATVLAFASHMAALFVIRAGR